MKILYIITLFLAFSLLSSGWQFVFDGGDEDNASDVIETEDGNYLITGMSYSTHTHTGGLPYLIKINEYGDIIWDKGYSGSRGALSRTINAPSGGFATVATKYTPSFDRGVYVIRTDIDGVLLWDTNIYSSASNHYGYDIVTTTDGGFVLAGEHNRIGGSPDNYSRFFLGKLDHEGNLLWEHAYGGFNSWFSNPKVRNDHDRGFICISPRCFNEPHYVRELLLLKTNPLGDSVWTKSFTFDGDVEEYWQCDLQLTYDGGYIVTGGWDWNLYIMKLDIEGNIIWRKEYGHPSNTESGIAIVQLPDSGYAVIGMKSQDPWLLRFDSNGDTLWTREIATTNPYNSLMSIERTSDGGYIMAGYIGRPDPLNSYDIWVVKTDSLGHTSIEETPTIPVPKSLSLSAYPNPFNSAVSINAPAGAEIEIFDVSGRRVATIPALYVIPDSDRESSNGVKNLDSRFHGNNRHGGGNDRTVIWTPDETLPSGVYLVRLRFDPSASSGHRKLSHRDVGHTMATKRVVYLK